LIQIPPARYILPNLFTLSATFCGFAAIWLSAQAETGAQFYTAASLIALAVFLDGFDGRVARMVHGETKMGVQLDSMSDFLTFGVAPAFLVYHWGLSQLGALGLVLCFAFLACAMLRLARFNVEAEEYSADDSDGPSRFFTGLPAPMAGMGLALLVGVNAGLLGRETLPSSGTLGLTIVVLALAVLMVSEIPFRTFKDMLPTRRNRLLVAGFLAMLAVVSLSADYMVALACGLACYFVINATGGLLSVARVGASRAGATVEDEDEDDEFLL
jgi:CDP-diacylglycerol--serine O-phosphatidyltransferase